MTHHENLKIVAFVGLVGSGKSTAVAYFTEKGYPKVHFGHVMYQAMAEAGIERTPETEAAFRKSYRAEHGNDVIANKIVEQIQNLAAAGQHRIIVDSLYSWTEYKVLKKAFPGELEVVAIVAPRNVRYRRAAARTERPYTATESHDRDQAEIENLEKGGPIAIADHYVINDGTVEELQEKLATISKFLSF